MCWLSFAGLLTNLAALHHVSVIVITLDDGCWRNPRKPIWQVCSTGLTGLRGLAALRSVCDPHTRVLSCVDWNLRQYILATPLRTKDLVAQIVLSSSSQLTNCSTILVHHYYRIWSLWIVASIILTPHQAAQPECILLCLLLHIEDQKISKVLVIDCLDYQGISGFIDHNYRSIETY